MVIKSKAAANHIRDIEECFSVFRKYKMKLNPQKCAFGVSSGQFLGYIVSRRGIEASPTQLQTLSGIPEPRTVKDVQSLTGKVAALSRFISKMSDKCKPFFDSIKQSGPLVWGETQNQALKTIKRYIMFSSLYILNQIKNQSNIYTYVDFY